MRPIENKNIPILYNHFLLFIILPPNIFHTLLSFDILPKKGVNNMQNSIHKQILFLFFLFLILIIVFSFILHTPKDVPNSVSFINYCSRIVVIEEGAFLKFPQEKKTNIFLLVFRICITFQSDLTSRLSFRNLLLQFLYT